MEQNEYLQRFVQLRPDIPVTLTGDKLLLIKKVLANQHLISWLQSFIEFPKSAAVLFLLRLVAEKKLCRFLQTLRKNYRFT